MKRTLIFLLAFISAGLARADGSIFVPNLPGYVTGTDLGGGHYGLDISGTVSATNPSVGPTGSAVPSSATFMGVKDGSGNLVGLSLGQALKAASLPVTLASDQTLAVAQSGTWTVQPGNTANTTPWLMTISQGGNSATVSAGGALKVDASASTQPVSGSVTVTQATGTNLHAVIDSGAVTVSQATGTNLHAVIDSSALPAGASNAANQATANTTLSNINSGVAALGTPIGTPGSAAPSQAMYIGVKNSTNIVELVEGQATKANSLPVTIASDQVAPKTYANSNATLSQSTVIGSGAAVTFSPPANAVGFVAMAPSSNAQNVRCASGTTATTTLGLRLEPGRDTGYIPSAATLTCIAESGSSQEVDVQWVQQ